MSGAISPDGQAHPGDILHDDQVDGRRWTAHAADVPESIAWVEADGVWYPVLRIEITGSRTQRRFTKFGPDDMFLETTIQSPPGR
jgi:hypothetical protein